MGYDLDQLRAFKAIFDHGSLGRAAQALAITQPALSRTVQRLEHQVGAHLFERHSKGMHPTELGRALYPHATNLLHQSDQAVEEMAALQGLAKGTIRVGSIASLASSRMLSTALATTLRRFPGLQAHVIEGTWEQLCLALSDHDIDLALGVATPDTADVTAIGHCRWTDTIHIVAACTHPLHALPAPSLADALANPWVITPKGSQPHEHLQQLLASQGHAMPAQVVYTRSISMLKSLVVHSGFVSWCPLSMIEPERSAQLVAELPIQAGVATRELSVFRRTQGRLPLPAARLLEAIGEPPPDR